MNTKILEDLGLTKSEIKVYLALLELGSSSAGDILKKANIHNSVFHFTINNLIEKGLVTYLKKGKARVYQPADPESLLSYVEDKKTQLKTILPELKKKQTFGKEKEQAEIFEGIKGIQTALYSLIKDTKPKDKFLFFSVDEDEINEDIEKFYKRYDLKREQKKLNVMGIAPIKLKNVYMDRSPKMKYVNFPIPVNTGLCNDKMVIITWKSKPRAILIKSKSIVKKQKKFFEEIWKQA